VPTAKLAVLGMQEQGDARRLETALLELEGVHGVVASCAEGCVEVDFEDDRVTAAQMIAAAGHAGFEAQLAG
jgi:copper chaperone CopZ